MAKRIGKHLRGNVVGYLALFVALGVGTAYALDRNSVKSKHIAPGAVKLSDTNDKLRLKCPGGTRYHEGVCIEPESRSAAMWVAANDDCLNEGRRLATRAELLSFRLEPGITLEAGYEWTDDFHRNAGNTEILLLRDNGDPDIDSPTAMHEYRCVAPPKR